MKPYAIEAVHARRIYDSRANPTIEVEVVLAGGTTGRGMVPSGASTGKFEALELPDGDSHFGGKGVAQALHNVNEVLGPAMIGLDARDQRQIDARLISLDGTPNKSKLGANAILGCSLAACYAAANYEHQPLYRYLGGAMANTIPVPMVQIIGGGAHAANAIDIQDFLVIPISTKSFAEGYAMVAETYLAAKKLFQESGRPVSIADEGGFWPTAFKSNEDGLRLLTESIEQAGYCPGKDLGIALDIASSEFFNEKTGTYTLSLEDREYTPAQFIDLLCDWVARYPIVSIEDGTGELDWDGCRLLTERLGRRIQIVGDDLFTTNIERIRRGVSEKCCNAVLIKMNQIGTITETMEAISYTKSHGYLPVISARSGETEDATIVHLAIASGAGQLKVGSAARSERTAKWNEAIRIEEALGASAYYPSQKIFLDSCISKFNIR
ncbi:enolase [Oscillibacter sp. PC13]|uniref:phosphopyruvate hydratase n=1 Tax=Oscillibacter sp. PC13 TaxID=1855299 RepID=UPI0008E0B392|nr:phosphopyruvate hydratase [Oscillibacter sp. PC13]SFP36833.1 enolase [Oscillibacter sp. PC13]